MTTSMIRAQSASSAVVGSFSLIRLGHRAVLDVGVAEVALGDVLDVVQQLHGLGIVEVQVLVDGRQHLRRGARARDAPRGIARQRELQDERQQDHAGDRDQPEHDPDRQISSHERLRETEPRRDSASPISTNEKTVSDDADERHEQQVRGQVEAVLPLREHVAPLGPRRLDAGSEVGEARPDRDDGRAVERGERQDQARHVRQDVAPHHACARARPARSRPRRRCACAARASRRTRSAPSTPSTGRSRRRRSR